MLIPQENTICIVTSGLCGRRGLDLAKFKSYLSANGYNIVFEHGKGGILAFWGCAFNASNEQLSMQELTRYAPQYTTIFVMEGIAMTVSPEKLRSCVNTGVVSIPMNRMEELDKYFWRSVSWSQMAEENDSLIAPPESGTIWFVQVAHGCLDNCSYCGDKKVVGELKSKPLQTVLEECRAGLAKGCATIHLLGDDIGAYGRDIGITVFDLLDAITALPELESLELEEINIKYLLKDIERLRSICSRKKFKLFAMAFQHVDDGILQKMNRGYSRQEMELLFDTLSAAEVRVRFHAIIGFPGETGEQLSDLLSFIVRKEMPSGDVFIYQKRDYGLIHK